MEKQISDILYSIDNGEYNIPEFQRGYVWNSKQVKGFFRSLYLGYPSGSFLIWKTKNPSKTRGTSKDTNSVFHQLILDGQQRLTTIYTIFRGQTPDWYEGVSLRTDLYFNLEEEVFEYYTQRKMGNSRQWISVSKFLSQGGLGTFLTQVTDLDEDTKNYYYSQVAVLTKLDAISKYGYYIKEITINELDKVVEIFNLVNKTGTTLSESDLALAVITSNWPDAKDQFRQTTEEFRKHNFKFSFGHYTRLLNIFCLERGHYSNEISKVTAEEFEAHWKHIKKILYYLINVLRETAYIDSSSSFNSLYVLYVLSFYLKKNGGQFTSEAEAKKAIFWMFMSLLWGRFSGSSESFLEKDMNAIKAHNSIDALIHELQLKRGSNLYLRPEDISLQGAKSKIYNLFYCAIRSQNAKDWTNPMISLYSKNIGYNNKLQKHHIFPKAFLYKKYNSRKSVDKALVNEIANIALITQESNIKILDGDPGVYLPKIDPVQLRKQFVPTEDSLYRIDSYEQFLDKRRKNVVDGINQFLKGFYDYQSDESKNQDLKYLDDEIEKIELCLRDIVAEVLEKAADSHAYEERVAEKIREVTNQRISSFLAKQPGEDPADFASLRRKLDFFNLNDYKEVIVSKQNFPFFADIFGQKGTLEIRFKQLSELRNALRHSRGTTEIMIKDADAAISWFSSVIRPYLQKLESQTQELS